MTAIEEDVSQEFSPKEDSNEQDQRRLSLIHDPNYGIILCFLDKFRSVLDLPVYSYQRLEDHLVHYQERVPSRLIDLHFILLKRLSLAKNTQREKFDSIITKFASRFDYNDGEQLTNTGYLQADMSIKLRIIRNLLESQFDLNLTFMKTLIDKPAREIKSTPIGRDRFGVSYWLFTDADCFVRLFREDVDLDRTWSNVAKNRDEFEKFIKLLIADAVTRKKFSDWTIDYEPFSSITLSNEFEELYPPPVMDVKEESIDEEQIDLAKKKRGKRKNSMNNEIDLMDVEIKREAEEEEEEEEEKPQQVEQVPGETEKAELSGKRKRGRPKSCTTPTKIEPKPIDIPIKQEEETEVVSNDDESIKKRRRKPKNSIIKEEKEVDTPDTKKRVGRSKNPTKALQEEEVDTISTNHSRSARTRNSIKSMPKIEPEITSSRRSRKRQISPEDNSQDEKPNDESSLRRSTRPRKAPILDPTSVLPVKTSPQISSKKKRSMNGKSKSGPDTSVTPHKSTRSRRRRKVTSRRHSNDEFCLSTSSSDEHIDYLSDNDYESDDYLPDPSQLEQDENFFALDEDNHLNGDEEELRSAKTAHASTIITTCQKCTKSDRPEVLLLCDDCDDAYHIDCLRPTLLSVPDGDWFCPLCEQKKLSNNLIEKLKELLINFTLMENKRVEHEQKKTIERKIKTKDYSSDESITASETEEEPEQTDQNLHGEESMLSISQTNENSNMSSNAFEDSTKNISQRGRHRRTRFDMNKMLNNDNESDEHSNTDPEDDEEYIETATQFTNFDVQIPKKMTRLLTHRYRPIARNDQRLKPKPIVPRFCQSSVDLNEKFGSPIIYINGENNSHQIKSVITNSNQTLKIVRRWNDVQRRNRLRTNHIKSLHDTTSDCADENSVFCPDDASPPRSNDSNSNYDTKDDDSTIIRSKITLNQPTNLLPICRSSSKHIVKKNEVNFDQLTRDIQFAVSEASTLSAIPKAIDQQQTKRVQKTNFSPYLTKIALRPLPVLLPKPIGVSYKIFKSKDPPNSTTTTTDLSNIMLTPSSSSSLLDSNDDQGSSTTPI